ncbi:monosaccharide ABC transporter membrane protein, CUT2 family [Longilinea arvoryzae]|uniref:Monosaccharide ABC transporter membrane protein, CUT2 family n=1 Tax=Longilinea arvoryzae TaxID=360412 RepID=A0A0S7BP90_9CHLR|nr:ABC transporter permease [Longilinea arvoryzae]GAP15761.1 monosaccharide ABC transporter membrane protein, CUT2 family [Longilinea arvoryzae]
MTTLAISKPRAAVSRFCRTLLSEHLIWVLLVALCIGATSISGFLTVKNVINIFWAATSLGCMVLGMFLVMLTGGTDLSLESTLGFAPAFAVLLMTSWMKGIVTPWMAVIITLLVGAAIGSLNGFLSVKLRVNSFLITLGTMTLFRGLLVSWIPEGIYYLPKVFLFLGKEKIGGLVPVAVIVFLLLYVFGYLLTEKMSIGKAIYAIGNNEHAAYIAGLNIDKIKILAFVLAGLFAATGGLIESGRISSVIADLGSGTIMNVFTATILGGTSMSGGEGRITGVFAGVLVLTIIDNMLNLLGIDPSIRQVVQGIILLIAIILTSLQKRVSKQAKA